MENDQKIKCDFCGELFDRKRKDNRAERTSYKNFCSPKCYFESKKNGACVDCGSVEIIKHDHKVYPKKICGECLEKRKDARRNIRVVTWREEWEKEKKAKCGNCGALTSKRERLLSGNDWSSYCKKCKTKFNRIIMIWKILDEKIYIKNDLKRFKFCDFCGKIFFDKSQKGKSKFCSRRCINRSSGWELAAFGLIYGMCQDCGKEIKSSELMHKSNGYVCDECMYIRRRTYKDKKIYGDEFANLIRKVRLIEASGNAFEQLTEKRGAKCRSPKRLDWKKVVDQLKK